MSTPPPGTSADNPIDVDADLRRIERKRKIEECDRAIESALKIKAALLLEERDEEDPMVRFRRIFEAACRAD